MVVVVASQYSMLEGQGQIALCQMAAVIFTRRQTQMPTADFSHPCQYIWNDRRKNIETSPNQLILEVLVGLLSDVLNDMICRMVGYMKVLSTRKALNEPNTGFERLLASQK